MTCPGRIGLKLGAAVPPKWLDNAVALHSLVGHLIGPCAVSELPLATRVPFVKAYGSPIVCATLANRHAST